MGRNYTQSITVLKGVTLSLKPQTVNQKENFPQTVLYILMFFILLNSVIRKQEIFMYPMLYI